MGEPFVRDLKPCVENLRCCSNCTSNDRVAILAASFPQLPPRPDLYRSHEFSKKHRHVSTPQSFRTLLPTEDEPYRWVDVGGALDGLWMAGTPRRALGFCGCFGLRGSHSAFCRVKDASTKTPGRAEILRESKQKGPKSQPRSP